MSLSRPARFPLLKLPFLCIKVVVKSWDLLDLIFFALYSKKTRRIVKCLKIPLNRIEIRLSGQICIKLDSSFNEWYFSKGNMPESSFRDEKISIQNTFLRKTGRSLKSYIDGNESIASKLATEFLNEVFKCSVERVDIDADNFPESGDIGVRSTRNLYIKHHNSQPLSDAQHQKLKLLLENLEVTDTCVLWVKNTENGFYVDPKLFKCRKLMFFNGTAAWVTLEILLQFDVPRFTFFEYQNLLEILISPKDWKSFVMTDYKQLYMLEKKALCFTYGIINESGEVGPHGPIHSAKFCILFLT
ncbi:hypothetical protein CAEBREN_26103 [Caenorhabditis brenneri]|uniref:F-box domain-containing protein n=1 Tax=Caenorhabditis brenneri TaxID=135651 RepID=G0P4H8_CAEBE|nr:hypothetical protein CAEBREN_26103 [Caenorhabditis brenneri]